MKKVTFQPFVNHTMTEEEWTEFLNAAETDIDHELSYVEDFIKETLEKTKKTIKKKRAQKDAIDDNKYKQQFKRAIQNFKIKLQYLTQMLFKVQECRTIYEQLLNLYTISATKQEPTHEEIQYTEQEEDTARRAEAKLSEEYIIEWYKSSLEEKTAMEILKGVRKFMMIQLTKTIIDKRKKHEKAEDLIVQIIANIAIIQEYHSYTLNK